MFQWVKWKGFADVTYSHKSGTCILYKLRKKVISDVSSSGFKLSGSQLQNAKKLSDFAGVQIFLEEIRHPFENQLP